MKLNLRWSAIWVQAAVPKNQAHVRKRPQAEIRIQLNEREDDMGDLKLCQ
jgi:hypothetical protein